MGLDEALTDLAAALACRPTGERARFDAGSGTLVGTRCSACGRTAWPGRAVCHHCGSADVRECAFGGLGTMVSCTEVWVPRPGLPTPYVLGQVRLADGPVVFGMVTGLAQTASLPVDVVVRSDDGRYWFEPASR